MKVLWASNGPSVQSGYGIPTRHMLKLLKNDGYEVACQAFYGVAGNTIEWNGIKLYPAQGHQYGVDVIGHHAADFGADLVITLVDNWALPVDYGQRFAGRWLCWFPVDGDPVPQASVDRARAADYAGVFSRDGVAKLAQAGVKVEYLPYGIDCNVFKPGGKAAAREALGIPADVFFVVTVGANRGYPARKGWPELLQAFKLFSEQVPEARLYLHTRQTPISTQGIEFAPLLKACGLDNGKVSFADPQALAIGVQNEDLAQLYQAADVMLLPSMAEGFGLPIAEAQACGCPVITTDCSSMTELTRYGLAIPPIQKMWVPVLNYWWGVPNVDKIANSLEIIHAWVTAGCNGMARVAREVCQETIDHFRTNYDWPVVYAKHWKPLLERIEAELW